MALHVHPILQGCRFGSDTVRNWFVNFGLLLCTLGWAASVSTAGESTVILDMDTLRHEAGRVGSPPAPIGTVELVEGHDGAACRFDFGTNNQSGFFSATVRSTPSWDQAAGFSFWVKGDGSSHWGGLELIDRSDFALRYGFCFPIDSTEWRRITVAWRDLVPELPQGAFVGGQAGYAPSRFGHLWFGKWFYWRDFPACSFAIDQVVLEPTLEPGRTDDRPTRGGAPRLGAKLRAREPITLVTLGDSLTDKRHWANRDLLWAELLASMLHDAYGSEVTLVNPAIGGTQLTQNLVLMPRWLRDTPEPDLVTVWFGYNDWDAGARGADWEQKLRFAVERIRRMTRGSAEVVLMTSCPTLERWETLEELAVAARTVAVEENTGLADVAAAFHERGVPDTSRAELFAWDKTHLGEAGHRLVANTVFQALR